MIKKCAWCKKDFDLKMSKKRYCNICKEIAKKESGKRSRLRIAGLSGDECPIKKRYLVPKKCVNCDADFMAISIRAKYCQVCRRIVRNRIEHDRVGRKHAQVLEVYRQWRQKNPDYMKEWRSQNIEHCQQYGEEYHMTHPEIFEKSREKQRRRTDPFYRVSRNLRARLNQRIKRFLNGVKVGSAIQELGCTNEELIQYLESKFQIGMSWDNYGKYGWHIDHMKPLAAFDLTDLEQFKQACHYTNLQPLWARDNLEKGSKV